jgi:hypothetical protein
MASAVRLAAGAGGMQDRVMKRVGRLAGLLLGSVGMFSGCSRQPVFLSPKDNAQNLPFNDTSHSEGISPTQAFASASIPVGTAMAIRLQSSVSSALSHPGDQFQAVLDGPIMVQGQTLAPSGTEITGTIVAARASQPRHPGYLRLTLSGLVLNGKTVTVNSSSIFSKGDQREHGDVKFSTGRRLTFRLIQALPPQG